MQGGDLGCRALYGAPRVQPLNDYRLIYFVKKCLDAYIVSCLGCWGGFCNVCRRGCKASQPASQPPRAVRRLTATACFPPPPPSWPQAKYRVMVPCGDDVRLYSSPLIKFSKACTQLVSGRAWYLSGEWPAATAGLRLGMAPLLPLLVMPHVLLPRPPPGCKCWCAIHGCLLVSQPTLCPLTQPRPPAPPLAVRVGYPCFGTPRRVNGKIVGYPAWGRYRVHNL